MTVNDFVVCGLVKRRADMACEINETQDKLAKLAATLKRSTR